MNSFNEALGNFTTEMAGGGAIRHLADLGYSVSEIKSRLAYPISTEKIGNIVWNHYIETGVISLSKPESQSYTERVSYIRENGKYGRSSLKRVVERIEISDKKYIECNFGLFRYKDKKAYELWLDTLQPKDKEYIENLPWPLTKVYHVEDERIRRIQSSCTFNKS